MTVTQSNRLDEPWGTWINRAQTVEFTFDGRPYRGYPGDTLSSALAANGRFLVSRSFKYHRPRASMTFAGLDANAYVQLGDEPNVSADLTPIINGLSADPQNVLGSLDLDLASTVGFVKRFLPVGFYYRAFYRPRGIWNAWERLIRRASGLGRINPRTELQRFCDKMYLFADVLVIGAGPAGMSAAVEAAALGASVILADESPVIGGSLCYARFGQPRSAINSRYCALRSNVESSDRIKVMTTSTCSGWFSDNWLSVQTGDRLFKIRAKHVVLATGSVEQPAVFRNNDLPGVLLSSAVQRLLRLYGVRPGHRAVVITANQDGYDVADDLLEAGVEVAAIVDLQASRFPKPCHARVETVDGFAPHAAIPSRTGHRVAGIELVRNDGSQRRRVECDLIVTAVGYAPLGQLACHAGARLSYNDHINAFCVIDLADRGDIAGSLNHQYDLDAVCADGAAAGRHAVESATNSTAKPRSCTEDPSAVLANHAFPIFKHPKGGEFVDFDEDQTIADLKNAVADGFGHPELAKRYSTTGMGPSQGRLSATNALRIVAREADSDMERIQTTTQRPPFRPISLAILAGRKFEPERRTVLHDWHVAKGAEFLTAGAWLRPSHYASCDDRDHSVRNEVAAIRQKVGLIDVSTLGGIDVRGPDAAAFLNRLYTFTYLNQPTGKIRYILMTDESGAIVDDGVACRLGAEHFYVTTTTTGSDEVVRTMLRKSIEWGMRVDVVNLTSAFAAMNIAGRLSRNVLQMLDSDIDFSAESFPYLGVRLGHIENFSLRALRVGFVGELSFELHVPSRHGQKLWERLLSVGEPHGILPVGIEAQRLLRLEKAHIIVGQDTDGLTTPGEAGMDWAVTRDKPYFVGRAAIAHIDSGPARRRLVGFELPASTESLPQECSLVLRAGQIAGRVTSVARSVELNKVIGLAYVHPEDADPGCHIVVKCTDGSRLDATVVETPFLDPENWRQHV